MADTLSRIGIGSATVDTVLPEQSFEAGTTIEATVTVEGGTEPRHVDVIYLGLMTRYRWGDTSSTSVINSVQLTDDFTIDPGCEEEIPVSLFVPPETPVTMDASEVWVETRLDINWTIDPEDVDKLDVAPGPYLDAFHGVMCDLGFELETAAAIDAHETPFSLPPFVQGFAYRPQADSYGDDFDDVAVLVRPTDDHLELILEVDRGDQPLTDWGDESGQTKFAIETADTDYITSLVHAILDEYR
jgi:sporulation-control protein